MSLPPSLPLARHTDEEQQFYHSALDLEDEQAQSQDWKALNEARKVSSIKARDACATELELIRSLGAQIKAKTDEQKLASNAHISASVRTLFQAPEHGPATTSGREKAIQELKGMLSLRTYERVRTPAEKLLASGLAPTEVAEIIHRIEAADRDARHVLETSISLFHAALSDSLQDGLLSRPEALALLAARFEFLIHPLPRRRERFLEAFPSVRSAAQKSPARFPPREVSLADIFARCCLLRVHHPRTDEWDALLQLPLNALVVALAWRRTEGGGTGDAGWEVPPPPPVRRRPAGVSPAMWAADPRSQIPVVSPELYWTHDRAQRMSAEGREAARRLRMEAMRWKRFFLEHLVEEHGLYLD